MNDFAGQLGEKHDAVLSSVIADGDALAMFSCYDFGTATAVLSAAEQVGRSVGLLIPPVTILASGGERLVTAIIDLAGSAQVSVVTQLDHCTDAALAQRAIVLGVNSVMADGSRLGDSENARFVKGMVDAAQERSVTVEAELGRIEGREDLLESVNHGRLTDPGLVQPFVSESGCDVLAISVGNVHGAYSGEPRLEWGLLERLVEVSPVPLSLHGTSGLSEADLTRALRMGVRKFNVNTELRRGFFDVLERSGAVFAEKLDVHGLCRTQFDETQRIARHWLTVAAGV